MSVKIIKLIASITGLVLALGLVLGPPKTAASPVVDTALSSYRAMVQRVAAASWAGRSQPAPDETIHVLVQLDVAPLALGGPSLDAAAYTARFATITNAQERLSAAVRARGGQTLAEFRTAAVGQAVSIRGADLPALRAIPGVLAVLPIADYAVAQAPSETTLTLRQVSDLVGSTEVRRLGNNGAGVDIAIVDSGIDYTHSKLGGPGTSGAYNRAYCGGELIEPGDPSCDPTLDPPLDLFPNGKVRGGYDWIGDVWPEPDPECSAGPICTDRNPIDGSGHGTHVADIVAGQATEADGADAGIAPGANVWAFKACNGAEARCQGTALLRALDNALDLDGSNYGRCRADLGELCAAYDPADIITMAISFRAGQPEDALILFTEIAGFYGSLVITAAGNDGDIPYVVGSPAAASAALAVAESTIAALGAPTASINSAPLNARHQAWSMAIRAAQSGELRHGDGLGGNLNGCETMTPWSGALLVERGGCTSGFKARNAVAAGAGLLLIADVVYAEQPPALRANFGGLPVLSITRAEADALRAALVAGPLSLNLAPAPTASPEQIADTSSRGPRIFDSAIKPDIAAPGAILSAAAGTGSALAPFAGSSGSTPVVAGAAALMVQELEERGAIDPGSGLRDRTPGSLSLAPIVKALLMNTAMTRVERPDGSLAPITLQGSGRVNALAAFRTRTVAMDVTEITAFLAGSPTVLPCSITPYLDLINYLLFDRPPPCAVNTPFGDPLMRAWNAQTGSISFGYRPVAEPIEIQRQVAVVNFSRAPRSYQLSTAFRYADDLNRGVSLTVSPRELSLEGNTLGVVTLTMRIDPADLREGWINAVSPGVCPSANPGCPSLQKYEIDGTLLIDGGPNNRINLPWHVLPHRLALTELEGATEDSLRLLNRSPYQSGTVEAFALLDISPNVCDQRAGGSCASVDYMPGEQLGRRSSPVDLALVGVRSRSVPGLNASFGLPPAPPEAIPDELVEFAVTVYDRPFRSSPNSPVRFEIALDSNGDNRNDYLISNGIFGGVSVFDLNRGSAGGWTRYVSLDASFQTQSWVLPVPAAAVNLRSDRPFTFVVRAFDAYFGGAAWDCSPGPLATCGATRHTFQTGLPRYVVAANTVEVPPGGRATLFFEESLEGSVASPSQIGLMLLFDHSAPGRGSAAHRIR